MNLGKTWEKLMLAARVIAAIPNPKDVLVRTLFIPYFNVLLNVNECALLLLLVLDQGYADSEVHSTFIIDRI